MKAPTMTLIAAAHRPVARLLDRLDGVRDRGHGQWWASCPTAAHEHGDRSRGLSIKETADGTVLLRCFAGCDAGSIVAAVRLELHDLFPDRLEPRKGQQPRYNWREVLAALKHEVMVVAVAAGQIETLTDAEIERVQLAATRIHSGMETLNV